MPITVVIAALRSPLSLFLLPARAWLWLLVYLSACALEMAILAVVLVSLQEQARSAVLHFIFPESWHFAADYLVDRFLANQQRTVLINAAVSGGLLLITTSLFPLKEKVSSSFERHRHLAVEPMSEFPLWKQAWEEIKLLVLFVAAQGSIFWIGYHPGLWRELTAVTLSYAFLFASYAIDFISPIFQRHAGHYSQVLKTLAKNPMATLVFGALFSAPVVWVGQLWGRHPEWSFSSAISLLFAVNVVTIAWAVVAGTWLGARMLNSFATTRRSSRLVRWMMWALVLAAVGWHGVRFGAVANALAKKSQLLKCHYDIDFSSIDIDTPNLESVTRGTVAAGIHFDVRITNPNALAVQIEDNRLEVRHHGDVIATGRLDPIAVPSGEQRTQRVGLTLQVSILEFARGRTLLDANAYQVVLVLQLEHGGDFPIYLKR